MPPMEWARRGAAVQRRWTRHAGRTTGLAKLPPSDSSFLSPFPRLCSGQRSCRGRRVDGQALAFPAPELLRRLGRSSIRLRSCARARGLQDSSTNTVSNSSLQPGAWSCVPTVALWSRGPCVVLVCTVWYTGDRILPCVLPLCLFRMNSGPCLQKSNSKLITIVYIVRSPL